MEVQVTGAGAEVLATQLVRAWARCLVSDDASPAVEVRAVLDPAAVPMVSEDAVEGSDAAVVMDALVPLITRRAIEQQAGKLLMLHAAAVADVESGATALLVGPSGAGKTTLAATLGRRFGYLTDETAAVDDDLQVLPYPKPLSVLPASGAPVKDQVSPDDLGLLAPGPAPYPVRALVLLDRVTHHEGPPVVEPVATVDALPWLAAQTSYSALLERPLHRLAAVAQAAGGVRRVTYAEAADLIPVVAALLAEDRR